MCEENLEDKFNRLEEIIYRETRYLSNLHEIIQHPAYKEMISIGMPVVSLMLNRLYNQMMGPDWFYALTIITGENPIKEEHTGYILKMANDWLTLGKERGWI